MRHDFAFLPTATGAAVTVHAQLHDRTHLLVTPVGGLPADLIVLNHMPYFLAAATLGLCVNFLSNLIIKLSSATTVKLLAAVRGPLVVLCGMLLFAELVSAGCARRRSRTWCALFLGSHE